MRRQPLSMPTPVTLKSTYTQPQSSLGSQFTKAACCESAPLSVPCSPSSPTCGAARTCRSAVLEAQWHSSSAADMGRSLTGTAIQSTVLHERKNQSPITVEAGRCPSAEAGSQTEARMTDCPGTTMARVRLSEALTLSGLAREGSSAEKMPKISHLIGSPAAFKVYALREVAQLYELAQPQLSSAPPLRCRICAGAYLLERPRTDVRAVSSWSFPLKGRHRLYAY